MIEQKFQVGQAVIHNDPARERVNLPNPINAVVKFVTRGIATGAWLYSIRWKPHGAGTVREETLTELTR